MKMYAGLLFSFLIMQTSYPKSIRRMKGPRRHRQQKAIKTINSTPVCTVYTPDSILNHKELYKPLFVGNRMRHATCTGAAWFHGNYLAVLNLYGENITMYRFDEEKREFSFFQRVSNKQGARLNFPEQLTVSPDGKFLVVVADSGQGRGRHSFGVGPYINVYAIDLNSHVIDPQPIFELPAKGLIHSVRFTPDGAYFAYTSFDKGKSICICKVVHDAGNVTLVPVYERVNHTRGLKLKAVNFTHDNQYAVLAYALSIGSSTRRPLESLFIVHKFNQNGTLGDVVCSMGGSSSVEDVAFLNNDQNLVASDQANDQLLVYPFDPQTGQIGSSYTLVQNPEARLSFPHGLAASPDGNYLVATNYGDDKFNLYQID